MEPLDRSSHKFVIRFPVAVARSSSIGVAIHYVVPVLWMTSHWRQCDTGVQSDLMSMNASFDMHTIAKFQSCHPHVGQ